MATQQTSDLLSKAWINSQFAVKNVSIFQNKVVENVSVDLSETIYNVFMDGNSFMYVSGQEYLYKYSIGNYPESGKLSFAEEVKKFNPNQDVIIAGNSESILSTQTYLGNVITRDKDSLEQIDVFEGIGSPFKGQWSSYHNAYFVAGQNSLWKIDTVKDRVFAIEGYKIKDFAVNPYGQIAMVLSSGGTHLIKVIGSDLYKNIINIDFNTGPIPGIIWAGSVFYSVHELPAETDKYNGEAVIIDPSDKTYTITKIDAVIQKDALTKPTTTNKTIDIVYPVGGETLAADKEYEIEWISNKGVSEFVSISLNKSGEQRLIISAKTENSGKFKWKIPKEIELSNKYSIGITWLSSSQNSENSDESEYFVISDTEASPEEVSSSDSVSGMSYDKVSDSVIFAFKSGHIGLHAISSNKTYGLFVSGSPAINGVIASNDTIKQFNDVDKVRIFVGSERYLSDKWDSGVVETNLTSMYYGGGNNLTRGEKYYVHIQVHSAKYGWSDIQINEFIMPL